MSKSNARLTDRQTDRQKKRRMDGLGTTETHAVCCLYVLFVLSIMLHVLYYLNIRLGRYSIVCDEIVLNLTTKPYLVLLRISETTLTFFVIFPPRMPSHKQHTIFVISTRPSVAQSASFAAQAVWWKPYQRLDSPVSQRSRWSPNPHSSWTPPGCVPLRMALRTQARWRWALRRLGLIHNQY
jgi:hypothetical protein